MCEGRILFPVIIVSLDRRDGAQHSFTPVRDGPSDIRGGGGTGIFPHDKLFLSFCKTSYFFKSTLKQVFFIFNINNT